MISIADAIIGNIIGIGLWLLAIILFTKKPERPKECSYCGYKCFTQEDMQRHIESCGKRPK